MSELKYLNAVHLCRHLIPPTPHPLFLHLGFRFGFRDNIFTSIWLRDKIGSHSPILQITFGFLVQQAYKCNKQPASLPSPRFGWETNAIQKIWKHQFQETFMASPIIFGNRRRLEKRPTVICVATTSPMQLMQFTQHPTTPPRFDRRVRMENGPI